MITKKLMDQKIVKWKLLLIPLFPLIYLYYVIAMWLTPKIMRPGIHAIIGDTGGGKTLLAHLTAERHRRKKRHCVSNSKFNRWIKKINITDHFSDYAVKKPLENCVVWFDEIHRDFNKRENRKTEYNSVFIPLIEWLVTHRHNNVYAVYFMALSWDRLDVQFQDLIQKAHFVWPKKRPSFTAWLKDKRMRPIIRPVKLPFISRKADEIKVSDIDKYGRSSVRDYDKRKYVSRRKKDIRFKRVRPTKWPVTLRDLVAFDTHAFKNAKIMQKKTDQTEKTEKGEKTKKKTS